MSSGNAYKRRKFYHAKSTGLARPIVSRRVRPKKNTYLKKTRTAATSGLVTNWQNTFMPNLLRTTLTYTKDQGYLDAGGANWQDWIFNGNSIYDPDHAAGGSTVFGHSVLAAIYTYYRVLGSKISVTFTPHTMGAHKQINCFLYPSRLQPPTSSGEMMGRPNLVQGTLTTDNDKLVLTNSAKTAAVYGRRDCDDVGFGAVMASNPAHPWYWIIGISGDVGDYADYTCKIEYDTILNDVKIGIDQE